jgi:hypothetical protein
MEAQRKVTANLRLKNQRITEEEMRAVRTMSDFDLRMLISEIHDHGWPIARKLIPLILESERLHGKSA